MRKIRFAILIFLAGIAVPAGGVEILKTDISQLEFKENIPCFTLSGTNLGKVPFAGEFTIYDGKTKSREALALEELHCSKNLINIKLANKKCTWAMTCTVREKLFLLDGELENKTDEELWLEPEIMLNCKLEGKTFFWGGFDILPVNSEIIQRSGFKGKVAKHIGGGLNMPFPVSSLIGEKETVFIGHTFMAPISYNAAKVQPFSETDDKLYFSQRMVIAPKQKIKVNFILGRHPSLYGREEGIVQAIYDAFPESWMPVVGQDNLFIWGAHSHYRSWSGIPDYETERRFYSTIEWAYCPYKRSGDIYGRKELWDYKPERKFSIGFAARVNGGVFDYGKLKVDEFHEKRKNIFLKNGDDFGYAFYNTTSGTWCEIGLAKEKYPDAINEDTDGVKMIIDGWGTEHDKEIRVFPLGTSFGEVIRKDMKAVYAELNPPGFSFDCAAPGIYYRGPAVKNPELPGRAWDDKGIFIDQSVAINELTDFIHNLGKDKPAYAKPFVWSNGTLKGDRIMLETSIFDQQFASWMPLYRYNMGQRPGEMHGDGFMIDSSIPEWRSMSKAVFMDKLGRLATHMVFTDFQYGITEDHVTQNGNPQSLYCMSELLELVRLGWQAQIPVECNSNGKLLYKSRYGKGESTVLYFGNPWDEKLNLKFNVNNIFLGKSQYLFVRKMRDSASTENYIKKGITSFEESLPSRLPALFEVVCGISDLPEDVRCTVSSKKDIDKILFTIDFKDNQPFKTVLIPRQIRNFNLVSIKINSKDAVPVNCTIPSKGKIELEYRSVYFNADAEKILQFPFVDKNKKVSFFIMLPPDANQFEIKEGKHFQEYFSFCVQNKIIEGSKLLEIIRSSDLKSDKNLVAVFVGKNRASEYPYGISVNNNVIVIKADDYRDARAMCNELKYVMDRRFGYIIPFAKTNGMKTEVLEKFDILGKSLPFKSCFNSSAMEVKNEK